MTQAHSLPTGFSFRHKFEELPIFHHFVDGTVWRTGRIDGEFEVEIDASGDWFISEVTIETDNGRFGKEAAGRTITLDADKDERFYLLVLDAIDAQYASLIEELIEDEIATRDDIPAAA